MIDKYTFKRAVGARLEVNNFVRKGQSWYLNGQDAIAVLNIQKSDWSEDYFINIGIWLKALGEARFPKENQCHLSPRAESLFPEDRNLIRNGSSLDKGNIEALEELTEFIGVRLVPFLKDCTHEDRLRKLLGDGRFSPGFVRQDADRYLRNPK